MTTKITAHEMKLDDFLGHKTPRIEETVTPFPDLDKQESLAAFKQTVDLLSRSPAPDHEISDESRICLTMIVKNESAIIERCLEAALPFIDCWCITDTGSTDNTRELIAEFFKRHDLPGIVCYGSFIDFAQARNNSLLNAQTEFYRHGRPVWDYALLVDADMVLQGTIDKSKLTAPAYGLIQRNGNLSYTNTRLVRHDSNAKYLGVTHEYISVEGVEHLATIVVDDRGDGGSKGDKGQRDIRLLLAGLEAEPQNGRYMFYLAQVYREERMFVEAIQQYERRIRHGGWDEETWASWYGLARCYKEMGDIPRFITACLDAYNFRPGRGEPLHMLAEFYRFAGKNEVACLIAETLQRTAYPGDHLFVEQNVYDSGADKELSIAGFYSKIAERREAGYRSCERLTTHPDQGTREEAQRNFTHYARSAATLFGAETRQIDWRHEDGWAPMNPSVCMCEKQRFILIRTVNYKIADGQYPTIDGSGIIKTKNHILEANSDWVPVTGTMLEDRTRAPRGSFPVEGFEDCRLFYDMYGLGVSATVRDLADSDGRCEMVMAQMIRERTPGPFSADLENPRRWLSDLFPVRDYERDKTQKNWMPVIGHRGRFLYLCDPTITIDVDPFDGKPTVEVARHQPSRCLTGFRGSSQLIPYEDGWLCVTHEVTWRPERVYLHRFVRFDSSYRITEISEPFYFQHIGIEFCAGLTLDGDRLVASYGVNDASAHLAFFSPEAVNRALRGI